MIPTNIQQFRGRPPRRSVLTLHRRWQQDLLRQIRRHMAGRFVWHTTLQQKMENPRGN